MTSYGMYYAFVIASAACYCRLMVASNNIIYCIDWKHCIVHVDNYLMLVEL